VPRKPDTPLVGGLVPFSTIDYPGQLAAVIFLQGCPWRCGYCHNPHLQIRGQPQYNWKQIIRFLQSRLGMLDAVVFSGGEPTADHCLLEAVKSVKKMGFLAGIHTAGAYPERLEKLLPYLDWVGLDIKAPFNSTYDRITTVTQSYHNALASLQRLLEQGGEFEVRTTLHPRLLSETDVLSIATTLASMGVKHYALQKFQPRDCINEQLNLNLPTCYPDENLLFQIKNLFPDFTYR